MSQVYHSYASTNQHKENNTEIQLNKYLNNEIKNTKQEEVPYNR